MPMRCLCPGYDVNEAEVVLEHASKASASDWWICSA